MNRGAGSLCSDQYSDEQTRVQILYNEPENPANAVIPEFAFSLTCRKHEKTENAHSIPVSATMFSATYSPNPSHIYPQLVCSVVD